jgi:hypothetical protein
MSTIEVIAGLTATNYCRHALHGDEVVWVEKNCYGDLWIEMLHALHLEPLAVLPFTLAVDFEDDQWTFFKPAQEELRDLYGIDVQELTIWRPLIEHAVEQLRAGKLISTEADAYWLPDTAGTDYHTKHSKTTILLNSLDLDKRKLGYFHNAGYYELEGDDFTHLFKLDQPPAPDYLPLFAELVRIDRVVRHTPEELAEKSWQLLQRHLARIPSSNPFLRFGTRFAADLPEMQSRGLVYYHLWAFASIRQVGAAFDLAASHLRWLANFSHPELLAAAECFHSIGEGNKVLILKGARAVNSGRVFDASPLINDMASAWDRGMAVLKTTN